MNQADDPKSTVNDDNRQRILLLRIQAGIFVLVAAMLLMFSTQLSVVPLGEAIPFSMLIFLCSAIGMWGGLGYGSLRWLPIAFLLPSIGFFAGMAFGDSGPEFHIFCLSITIVVLLTTLILRFWKGELAYSSNTSRADALQFGIKEIFGWTTAIAIMFGVGRLVVPYLGDSPASGVDRLWALFVIAGIGSSLAISVVISIWALLGQQISILKVLILIAVIATAGAYNEYSINSDFFFLTATIVSQSLLCLAIYLMRRNGLRFVKDLES